MVLSKEICCGFPVVIDVLDVSCNENNEKSWKNVARVCQKNCFVLRFLVFFQLLLFFKTIGKYCFSQEKLVICRGVAQRKRREIINITSHDNTSKRWFCLRNFVVVFQWLLMSSTCRATKTTRNLERKSRESMPKNCFVLRFLVFFQLVLFFKTIGKILFFLPRKNWSFVEVSRNEIAGWVSRG